MEKGILKDYLTIDPESRKITIPSRIKNLGVESDANVKRLYFKIQKQYGEMDFTKADIRINYVNANGEGDYYPVADKQVEGGTVTFSWLVGRNATEYKGDVCFIVCAKISDIEGIVKKEFNTTLASLPVLEGKETTQQIVQQYPDIIEQILKKLEGATTITPEQIQTAVDAYLKKNPITFKETDPTVPEWSKRPQKPSYTAKEVGALPEDTEALPNPHKLTFNGAVTAEYDGTEEVTVTIPNGGGFSGNYNDLSNKPTIPTKLSELEPDATHNTITEAERMDWNGKSDFSGSYNDLTDKPQIPTVPKKLPNPYAIKFTGAIEKEYDGSSEITINIPTSGGGTSATNYVTPEQYGAKGDGVTDDTAAFQKAIDSKQPIICRAGKFYKLPGKLVAKNSVLHLNGNGSQLIGLQIDINSTDGANWVDQYKSYEAIIKNCTITQSGNKPYGIFMAGPLRLENIDIINYTEFLKMSANYLDNFSAFGITHYVPEGTTDYVTFNLMGGLGDRYLIERCHFVKVKAWGKQPITFLQCLNGGFFGRSSQANFIGCHLETFTCELEMSEARFIGCYIWSNINLPKSAAYDKCAFIVHWMTNNARNDFRALNTNNCKVYIHQNETTGYQTAMELDNYKINTNTPVSREDQCAYFNSKGGSIKFDGQTGDYAYTIYPSISPDTINGYRDANKLTHTENILRNGPTPLFTANGYFKDMFFHIFRKNPDGTFAKAVIPYSYYMIDTGSSLNGILWEKVTSIPEIKENKAKLINGIYVSDNPSNVNGENALVVNGSNGLVLVL